MLAWIFVTYSNYTRGAREPPPTETGRRSRSIAEPKHPVHGQREERDREQPAEDEKRRAPAEEVGQQADADRAGGADDGVARPDESEAGTAFGVAELVEKPGIDRREETRAETGREDRDADGDAGIPGDQSEEADAPANSDAPITMSRPYRSERSPTANWPTVRTRKKPEKAVPASVAE